MRPVMPAFHGSGTDGRSSLSNTTGLSYDHIGQDEISEAKEKDIPKKKLPMFQTSPSAKNRLDVRESLEGLRSPTETDRCVPKVHAKGKESFWDRVKRVKRAIVRSPFP